MNHRLIVAVAATVALLSGCSDADKTASTALPTAAEVATQTQLAPYRVQETFQVGEGVYVRSVAEDTTTNSLWIGTSVGVLQIDLQTNDMKATYTREDGLANEYVFAIYTDSKGYKWFGTDGGGMSRYRDGEWKTYFPMHGLADYWVYSFAEQKDGTIWVGTWAGLNRIDGETEVFSTYLEELVNEWVYGLDIDEQDRVWIGTEGGVNMYDGVTWHVWTHNEGLGASNGTSLPVSDNTGLGTRSRHDLSITTNGMETFNPNYVFDIEVASDGAVWAGTWGGGVGRYDGTRWTNYTTTEGLAGNIVYSIAEGPDGMLWFGTNRGLSGFDGNRWFTYNSSNGLLDNNVYDITVTQDGRVWVGTRNGVAILAQ